MRSFGLSKSGAGAIRGERVKEWLRESPDCEIVFPHSKTTCPRRLSVRELQGH